MLQSHQRHVHYYGQIYNWFVEKLVGLNHPILLLVGACLCYGLQSRLIYICVPVLKWTAIPESKVLQVFFSGTRMNEAQLPQKRRPNPEKTQNKMFDPRGLTQLTKNSSTELISTGKKSQK